MPMIIPDEYDKLFCRCDGSGASFVDSSTANPKTITANGNATQLSLHADFNGKRTAGFFNGTTDYVVVPDSADWDFGEGDYEVEFYVNYQALNDTKLVNFNANQFALRTTSSNVYVYQANNARIVHGWTPAINTWYKIKVNRTSNLTKLYIDDVECAETYNGAESIAGGTTGLYIGRYSDGAASYHSGWVKNVTVKKASTTVLDMRFDTPATSPLGPEIALNGTIIATLADYMGELWVVSSPKFGKTYFKELYNEAR